MMSEDEKSKHAVYICTISDIPQQNDTVAPAVWKGTGKHDLMYRETARPEARAKFEPELCTLARDKDLYY